MIEMIDNSAEVEYINEEELPIEARSVDVHGLNIPDPENLTNKFKDYEDLYGSNAPRIQAMETAMQLTFHRICDRKQPKFWPNMPLKPWQTRQIHSYQCFLLSWSFVYSHNLHLYFLQITIFSISFLMNWRLETEKSSLNFHKLWWLDLLIFDLVFKSSIKDQHFLILPGLV